MNRPFSHPFFVLGRVSPREVRTFAPVACAHRMAARPSTRRRSSFARCASACLILAFCQVAAAAWDSEVSDSSDSLGTGLIDRRLNSTEENSTEVTGLEGIHFGILPLKEFPEHQSAEKDHIAAIVLAVLLAIPQIVLGKVAIHSYVSRFTVKKELDTE